MGKIDLMLEYRMQGLTLGYDIAKQAKEDGADPVEALDRELKLRRRYNTTVCYSHAEWEKDHKEAVLTTYKLAVIIAMATLWGEFGFGGRKRLPDFFDSYLRYVMAIGKGPEAGGTSIDELIKTLEEKAGAVIDLDSKDFVVDFRRAKDRDKKY